LGQSIDYLIHPATVGGNSWFTGKILMDISCVFFEVLKVAIPFVFLKTDI